MSYRTIAEVKKANKAAGHYWFSPATLKAFASRVETPIIGGRYWDEATTTYNGDGREYKMAVADDTGDVRYLTQDSTVLRFATRVKAIDHLIEYVNQIESARL